MTNSGRDPRDEEMIAAFIDRRMSPEERQAFMKRLDAEEDLYEVFAETVRYRDQQSGRPAEVVEHPAARWRWGRIAAAAALVAAAVTPVVLLNLPAERYAPRLVADGLLGDVLAEGERWFDKEWATMRGPAPGTDEFDTAFRLGVRQVDLEVALRLDQGENAGALLGEMYGLLDGLMMAEVLRLSYEEVESLVGTPDRALETAEVSDAYLREFLGDSAAAFDLGQWTEAGVLAARGGNTDLLSSRAFRKALRGFPRQEWAESGHPLADQLDAVEGLLEAREDQLDLVRLEVAFSAIIDDR